MIELSTTHLDVGTRSCQVRLLGRPRFVKRKHSRKDAEEVCISCIQNALQEDSQNWRPLSSHFTSQKINEDGLRRCTSHLVEFDSAWGRIHLQFATRKAAKESQRDRTMMPAQQTRIRSKPKRNQKCGLDRSGMPTQHINFAICQLRHSICLSPAHPDLSAAHGGFFGALLKKKPLVLWRSWDQITKQKWSSKLPALLLMAEILHQLRLVVYPIIYRVLYTSQVVSRISAINSMNVSCLDKWKNHGLAEELFGTPTKVTPHSLLTRLVQNPQRFRGRLEDFNQKHKLSLTKSWAQIRIVNVNIMSICIFWLFDLRGPVEQPFRSVVSHGKPRWTRGAETRHEGFFDLLPVVNLEGWKTKETKSLFQFGSTVEAFSSWNYADKSLIFKLQHQGTIKLSCSWSTFLGGKSGDMDWSRVHFSISFSHVSSFLNKLIPTPTHETYKNQASAPREQLDYAPRWCDQGKGCTRHSWVCTLNPSFESEKIVGFVFPILLTHHFYGSWEGGTSTLLFRITWASTSDSPEAEPKTSRSDATCESLPGSIVDARGHPQITIPHKRRKKPRLIPSKPSMCWGQIESSFVASFECFHNIWQYLSSSWLNFGAVFPHPAFFDSPFSAPNLHRNWPSFSMHFCSGKPFESNAMRHLTFGHSLKVRQLAVVDWKVKEKHHDLIWNTVDMLMEEIRLTSWYG